MRWHEAQVAYAWHDLAVLELILARCEARRRKRNRWHLGWMNCYQRLLPEGYLRGGNASAKRKKFQRAELLRAAGIQLPVSAGIDTIDAALCALTAHLIATGAQSLCFGDAQTGYIVVPKVEAFRVEVESNS